MGTIVQCTKMYLGRHRMNETFEITGDFILEGATVIYIIK